MSDYLINMDADSISASIISTSAPAKPIDIKALTWPADFVISAPSANFFSKRRASIAPKSKIYLDDIKIPTTILKSVDLKRTTKIELAQVCIKKDLISDLIDNFEKESRIRQYTERYEFTYSYRAINSQDFWEITKLIQWYENGLPSIITPGSLYDYLDNNSNLPILDKDSVEEIFNMVTSTDEDTIGVGMAILYAHNIAKTPQTANYLANIWPIAGNKLRNRTEFTYYKERDIFTSECTNQILSDVNCIKDAELLRDYILKFCNDQIQTLIRTTLPSTVKVSYTVDIAS